MVRKIILCGGGPASGRDMDVEGDPQRVPVQIPGADAGFDTIDYIRTLIYDELGRRVYWLDEGRDEELCVREWNKKRAETNG